MIEEKLSNVNNLRAENYNWTPELQRTTPICTPNFLQEQLPKRPPMFITVSVNYTYQMTRSVSKQYIRLTRAATERHRRRQRLHGPIRVHRPMRSIPKYCVVPQWRAHR